MLPRYHVLYTAIFVLVIWIFAPSLNPVYFALIFLAGVFIDFDHYTQAVLKRKSLSFHCAFEYHKEKDGKMKKDRDREIRYKGDFHVFHTVEAHILMAVIAAFWLPAAFVFLGMLFHSSLDAAWILKEDMFYAREYFLTHWLWKRIKKKS